MDSAALGELLARRLQAVYAIWYPPDRPRPSMETLAAVLSANVAAVEISPSTLAKVFRGVIRDVSVHRAAAIAAHFSVTPDLFTPFVSDEEAEGVLEAVRREAERARPQRARLLDDIQAQLALTEEILAHLRELLGGPPGGTDLAGLVGASMPELTHHPMAKLREVLGVLTDRKVLLGRIHAVMADHDMTIRWTPAQLASLPVDSLASMHSQLEDARGQVVAATASDRPAGDLPPFQADPTRT